MWQILSGEERVKFLSWFQEQKDKSFRNKRELWKYDVNVQRQSCFAFRNLFLKLVKMDLIW